MEVNYGLRNVNESERRQKGTAANNCYRTCLLPALRLASFLI